MILPCMRAKFHTSICTFPFAVGKLMILLELLLVLNSRNDHAISPLPGALQKDPSLQHDLSSYSVAVLCCALYVFLIIIVYDDDVLIVNTVP